ncbi:MAG TPA: hypothetical protein VNI01_00355 [Elusimicrobiota bacterium]|jgi:hypothetical protein|nr:hypothetical protein [Elusimicrobiota bacterium]
MSEIPGTIFVDCPCCSARLEARRQDGKVVGHWKSPPRDPKSSADPLKAAVERLKAEKDKRAGILDGVNARLEEEKRQLEDKFRREQERVAREGDTGRPPSPFDLD